MRNALMWLVVLDPEGLKHGTRLRVVHAKKQHFLHSFLLFNS